MTQYSQHGEDMFIMSLLNDGLRIEKTVLDIGAADGKFFSNSRMFLEEGWRGILIEPNKIAFDEMMNNTRDFNVKCYNVAIAESERMAKLGGGTHYTLNKVNDSIGENVMCLPLNKIELPENIGIASIDAEGMDTIILQQLLEIRRPAFIIIEANETEEREKQIDLLMQSGYDLLRIFDVNTVWIDKNIRQ